MELTAQTPPPPLWRSRPRLAMSAEAAINTIRLVSKHHININDHCNGSSDHICITRQATERCHLFRFFSDEEDVEICSSSGMRVKVFDRYDRGWKLTLKRLQGDDYKLTGANFLDFHKRQQFRPGWKLYVWIGRTAPGDVNHVIGTVKPSLVIGIDLRGGNAAQDKAMISASGLRLKMQQQQQQQQPYYFQDMGMELPQPPLPRPPLLPPRLRPRLFMVASVAPAVPPHHCPVLISEQRIKVCDDYQNSYHDFTHSIIITTRMTEKIKLSWFLTEKEDEKICSPSGMTVKVFDRYDRSWQLILTRKYQHGYTLCGPNFEDFKIRQKFQPGWSLYVWIGRIGPDPLYPPVIGTDLRRNDGAAADVV